MYGFCGNYKVQKVRHAGNQEKFARAVHMSPLVSCKKMLRAATIYGGTPQGHILPILLPGKEGQKQQRRLVCTP
jgi:hypothetical protein